MLDTFIVDSPFYSHFLEKSYSRLIEKRRFLPNSEGLVRAVSIFNQIGSNSGRRRRIWSGVEQKRLF